MWIDEMNGNFSNSKFSFTGFSFDIKETKMHLGQKIWAAKNPRRVTAKKVCFKNFGENMKSLSLSWNEKPGCFNDDCLPLQTFDGFLLDSRTNFCGILLIHTESKWSSSVNSWNISLIALFAHFSSRSQSYVKFTLSNVLYFRS